MQLFYESLKFRSAVATILFINDQTYAMTGRAEWLRGHGYVVVVAGSLASALDALLNNPIDATVLDCHMPDAGTIALALKRIRPELPLVMLASYCAPPCPVQCEPEVCIAKADSPATLLLTLDALLAPNPRDQEAA